MRKVIRRASALFAAALVVSLGLPSAPANAHGEAAQEAWLRMGTIAFWDVQINGKPMDDPEAVSVAVNEEFTITGTAKVLETWPEQLADPELGFISVVAPGPPVIIKTRTVNGVPTPASIQVEKGGVYTFEIVLAGRRPSDGAIGPNGWHVHPIFGIHGAGSLIGPGHYVKVTGNQADFKNMIALKNGGEVDLETIGLGGVTLFNIIWFVIGMIWMIYWTVPKPTVTRLPVSLSVPLNSDGADAGLISKKDHQVCNILMAVTLAILIGGFIWQGQKYPNKIPLQVLRYKPLPLAMDAEFASAAGTAATYTEANKTLEMTVDVTNTGTSDAKITEFITSGYTFRAGDSLTVDKATIPAGATTTVKMSVASDLWAYERLAPIGETRPIVTGVVRIADSEGHENFATSQTFLQLN
jgi:methane/ammonia monooxygenase subunit B